MHKYLALLLLIFYMSISAAHADNVTIVSDPDATVRDLPGNAQIVTGGNDTIVIEGDDDVARRMLLGPRVRVYEGNHGANSLSSTCPSSLTSIEHKRCVRDFMKAQENIRKKYND